jgi:hypothetical protein
LKRFGQWVEKRVSSHYDYKKWLLEKILISRKLEKIIDIDPTSSLFPFQKAQTTQNQLFSQGFSWRPNLINSL